MRGVRELPILFSGSMVRAILDDRKFQTRRIIKPRWLPLIEESARVNGYPALSVIAGEIICPHGDVGGRLWVKESHRFDILGDEVFITYAADGAKHHVQDNAVLIRKDLGRWRPSIHMFRWASRIMLEIIDIKVGRLQDITPADAMAEGITLDPTCRKKWGVDHDPRMAFADLWDSINARRGLGWGLSPWVWVITFRRIQEGI